MCLCINVCADVSVCVDMCVGIQLCAWYCVRRDIRIYLQIMPHLRYCMLNATQDVIRVNLLIKSTSNLSHAYL